MGTKKRNLLRNLTLKRARFPDDFKMNLFSDEISSFNALRAH